MPERWKASSAAVLRLDIGANVREPLGSFGSRKVLCGIGLQLLEVIGQR